MKEETINQFHISFMKWLDNLEWYNDDDIKTRFYELYCEFVDKRGVE